MMKRQLITRVSGLAVMLGASGTALAHTGAAQSGLLAGVLHPLSGLDHLLVMLAVGIWAATLARGRNMLTLPIGFLLFMAVGALLAVAGVGLPLLESGIMLSVLLMGLLLLRPTALPLAGAASLVALFALLHGNAHGLAFTAAGTGVGYFAGFLLSTAALHATGILLGKQLLARQWAIRLLGLATGAAGAAMMLAGA